MFAFPDRKRSLGAPDLRQYDINGIAFKLFFNSGRSRPSDNEGGGGSHLDPEIRGGPVPPPKKKFFSPSGLILVGK